MKIDTKLLLFIAVLLFAYKYNQTLKNRLRKQLEIDREFMTD